MATTTINVNVQNALSGNRNPISLMGANLGKQFFTTGSSGRTLLINTF